MLARAVLQSCFDRGIRDFCLCAGSRNSDFVLGLLANEGTAQIFPFFDERAAAFFALGRLRQTGSPTAVVTTSGTAAAELLPAVVEAHYQALPLVLITADRPARYRKSGAPQAIEQVRLFGEYAAFVDLTDPQDIPPFPRDHPIHLNVCLEDPQITPNQELTLHHHSESCVSSASIAIDGTEVLTAFLQGNGPLLVVAGCLDLAPNLGKLLATLQVPILADATSGLHACERLKPWLLKGGERSANQLNVCRVLRLGGVPSFRWWRDLETRLDVQVCSLTPRRYAGLARESITLTGPPDRLLAQASVEERQEAPASWQTIAHENAMRLDTLLERYPQSEVALLGKLLREIPESASLFVGNSLPIRELSLLAASCLSTQRVMANRGANGIDGNLATFLGMASGLPEAWGLFGDLTTLYDLSAPSILPSLSHGRRRFVVIANGGGKIFRRLPHFRSMNERQWAVLENQHAFDFAAWAGSWSMEHVHWSQAADFTTDALPDDVVIELRPCPEQSEAFWKAWQEP